MTSLQHHHNDKHKSGITASLSPPEFFHSSHTMNAFMFLPHYNSNHRFMMASQSSSPSLYSFPSFSSSELDRSNPTIPNYNNMLLQVPLIN